MSKITAYIKGGHVRLIREAMNKYPFRFMFNPYPVNPRDPINSKWRIGIDYGSASPEMVYEFESFWAQLETPITETYRKQPILIRLNATYRTINTSLKTVLDSQLIIIRKLLRK